MNRKLTSIAAMILFAGAGAVAAELSTKVAPDVMKAQGVEREQVRRVAGLSMQLNAGRMPELFPVQGETFMEGTLYWLKTNQRRQQLRPAFGRISVPGRNQLTLKGEKTTWVSNQTIFECAGGREGTNTLNIYISRLSPAIAMESDCNGLTIFAGANAAAMPGFCALGKGEEVKAGRLEDFGGATMEADWILLWHGKNSPALGQKDNPFLVVPGTGLAQVRPGKSGGIDLVFAQANAKAALLLVDGTVTTPVAQTRKWAADGLPQTLLKKCAWWASHLAQLPIDVTETFEYDNASDRVSVKYAFDYAGLTGNGDKVAPLPPMLALAAKYGFGTGDSPLKLTFSGPLVYADTPTLFGPYAVIESASEYTWTLEGLKRYAAQIRKEGAAVPESEPFEKKLASEAEKIVKAGPLAPWIFYDDSFSDDMNRRTLYWGDAGENVYFLAEMTDLLGGSDKEAFEKYIAEYQKNFSPETYGRILPSKGARREFYHIEKSFLEVPLPEEEKLEKGPSLYSLYGLNRYCWQTGAKLESERWEKCRGLLAEFLKGRDWATLFWFSGGGGHGPGVAACNQNFAGLIGTIRLAKQAGDKEAEAIAYGQLAYAAALRHAMGKYRIFLYESGSVIMPSDPKWQATEHAGDWTAQLITYDCTKPQDDIQQIYWLDEFNARTGTFDPHGWPRVTRPYQLPFMNMTPELGRFLADHLKKESARHIRAAEEYQPDWYIGWAEAGLGTEHNMNQPCDAYNNFIARAWVLGQSPQELRRYIDVPHVAVGDYFYIHKLAEIARACRGVTWQQIE